MIRNTRRNVRSVFRDTSFLGVDEVPKCSVVQVSQLIYRSPVWASTKCINGMRGSRKFSQGGGGGVQIPRRGLTENFNMAKINNLAIPGGGGGGSGPPVPPLDPPMNGKREALFKEID